MKTAKNTSLNISNADLTALLLSLMIYKKKYMSITFSPLPPLSLSLSIVLVFVHRAQMLKIDSIRTNFASNRNSLEFMCVLVNRMHTSCKSCVHNFSHVICIVPKFIDVMWASAIVCTGTIKCLRLTCNIHAICNCISRLCAFAAFTVGKFGTDLLKHSPQCKSVNLKRANDVWTFLIDFECVRCAPHASI